MNIKIVFISLIIFSFIGCSAPSKKLETTYNIEKKEGMVVGTMCIENKTYSAYTFVYTDDLPAVNDYPNQTNTITFKNISGDFNENGNSYYLFTIVKPKGKFKFSKLKIYDNSGQKQAMFDYPLDFKFNVEEGKTSYFGQLNVNTKKKIFSVENQYERDQKWFAQKIPSIKF